MFFVFFVLILKMSPVVEKEEQAEIVEEAVVETGKRKRGGGRKKTSAAAEKKEPKPKQLSKVSSLYLTKVAPSLKKKKENEVKFNLRSIDDYIADDEIRVQQFLSLLHFIDQSSLVVSEFEYRQDVPYAISGAGLAKVMKLVKEVNDCKAAGQLENDVSDSIQALQSRFSTDRYKLPSYDRDEIVKACAKGNGSVRIILTKTSLETFIDQRAKNESVPQSKKPKQIKFLGAQFRYEPVFDVVFDDAEGDGVKPPAPKRRKKSPAISGSPKKEPIDEQQAAESGEVADDEMDEIRDAYEKESEEEDKEE